MPRRSESPANHPCDSPGSEGCDFHGLSLSAWLRIVSAAWPSATSTSIDGLLPTPGYLALLLTNAKGGPLMRPSIAAGRTNVKASPYIAAFVPDVGETQGELINKFPGNQVLPVCAPAP